MSTTRIACPKSNVFHGSSERKPFYIKDPGSAITHFIGFVMAATGALPLLHKAVRFFGFPGFIAMLVYTLSLLLLYGASSSYHTFDLDEKRNKCLKKFDHMMICVLIAGSYTPICLLVLPKHIGIPMLIVIWVLAALGILFKAFWVFCPKWISSVLYIGMGWTCVMAFPTLLATLTPAAFGWLLAGGVIYTIGGVIYALKLPIFNGRHKNFGSHEIFHLFVMAGSLCHYIFMFYYAL